MSVLSAKEWNSDLYLSASAYAPGKMTTGSLRYWPVSGVFLKTGSSRALSATAAARFPPAESPPTRKPFLRSTFSSPELLITYSSHEDGAITSMATVSRTHCNAAYPSLKAVGKGCSGARL